jgi:hypothetical protein
MKTSVIFWKGSDETTSAFSRGIEPRSRQIEVARGAGGPMTEVPIGGGPMLAWCGWWRSAITEKGGE